jgi:ArsR family transcriptional regulator, arsenate/arsenite/antimonite-responsive transcriptional repressor
MAQTKTSHFDKKTQALAAYAKALSHPARIAILNTIAKNNSCICGEIVEVMPLAQSTVSQHLKELKEAGLITGELDGPKSCYCINTECLRELENLFSNFLKSLIEKNKKNKCC